MPYAGTTSTVRIPVSFDNSETINPSGLPVPSVFNGDFEEGALNRSWLLQYSAGGLATNLTGDLPGWSFHGGRFEKNYAPGDRLIALANGQHAAMLDNDNSWIQHNRMVVPDWAEYLSFDVQVLDAGDGETLRVSGYLPDSDSWMFLGAVAVDSEGSGFVNRLLEVPVELRGAGRMLKFSLSAAGSADAEILLDHVQFSRGLITDSTTDESDRGVFFTDTAGGLNSQWVELSNGFTGIVHGDRDHRPERLPGVRRRRFRKGAQRQPGARAALRKPAAQSRRQSAPRPESEVQRRFRQDLRRCRPADREDRLVLHDHAGNGSVRDEVVDLFYLPDFADGDAGDGVWTMMDTLDGKTRTLAFDNAAQVEVKPLLNPSGLFSVDVVGDIAQGIKYQAANPSAVEDFADYQIEEGGRNLGKIRVTARAVEKQTVGVSLSTLRTMVQAIRTEYEQWLADPTTPVHDANGFATGNYGTFVSLFSPLITDAEWAEVLTGFHNVFGKDPTALGPVYPASIYLPSIEQTEFAYGEIGLNPIVMINRPWLDVADNESRSFAGIDFAYSSFESDLTEAGGGLGSFGGKLLRDDISIPAKRFLLSQVVNPLRSGAIAGGKPMTLVVDGILRAYLNVGDTRQDVGESFGWVVGHELAHNLGLFDEYIYTPFNPVPRDGGDNFMSTANTVTVANRQREALHLAMDNPETTVSLAGTNALATWYLDLDALDASNRPGRIALALAPGAGDGDPEADPLTALLAFVGMQGAATADVISQSLLLNGEVHAGIVNGAFDVADVTATDYGWMAVGQAGVANGQGVLGEDPRLASRLVQTFTVPEQAQLLRFELLGADFLANDDGPSDAFEVALLDMAGNAVAGTIPVANSDALFNLQAGGKVFAAASVSASGLVDRNGGTLAVAQPVTVSIDLSGIAAGTVLTLYFDLLGFSGAASRLRIDNVNIVSAADSGNLPPVASSSAISASEEGAAVALALSAPTDVDSPLLSILVSALPTIGEVQYADGSTVDVKDSLSSAQLLGLKYLPPAEYKDRAAVGRFSYSVSDGVSTVSGETVITLTAVNDAPFASSSAIVANEEGAAVALGLSAPTDVDSSALSLVVTALPTIGELQYADGSAVGGNDTLSSAQLLGLKYLPPAEYNGRDIVGRFNYRVSDGSRTASGETTIVVTPVNDAPLVSSNAITAVEGVAAVALGLRAPSDVDGPLLTITVSALPTRGVVQYADGSPVGASDTLSSAQLLGLKYLPPVLSDGNDDLAHFRYSVSDGSRSTTGQTTITVIPSNYAPVASSSAISASEEGAAVALGLSAPTDVDSSILSIVVSGLPTLGIVQYADGSAVGANDTLTSAQLLGLKYLPPAEYNGSNAVGRFSYRVSDGQRSVSGETTISVTPVNDAPVAVADSASVDVRGSLLIDVLANDTDAENQALTLISVGGAARGDVVIENGKLRYTPFANGFGADRFSYLLADSEGATASGMVDVLVTGNHAPTLAAMADVSVSEGQSLTVIALGSDVDPGDTLTYSLVAAPPGASIDPSSGVIVWQALDGGSYDFSIRVADRAGEVANRSFTAKVLNVAPTLRLAGSPSILVGEVYTLVLSSSDPGHDSINNWRIDWGDGQVIDYTGQPRQLEHRYSGVTGALQIRATATDEDGSYLLDPLPLTVLGRALPATPSSSDGNGLAVRFNDTFDNVDGFDSFDVVDSGVTNAYASLAGSAGSAQQPRAIDLPFSLSTPGSLPPTLLAEQLRPAGDDAVRALPQIDFRPRPAGFRFPVGHGRGVADDWRKSFVTDMARKSHDPNHDLRVRVRVNAEPPGQSLPLPEELLDALPEATQDGSPNRARQGVPSGKPVILPEDAQELSLEDSQDANKDLESDENQESQGALERLMLALPLLPFGPTASRRSPKTRRSQTKAR
ncbi:MAG: Ig-like domain-containing protein [Candidatus Accumulibacter meliphilus]|uniref:Ig-like domain-containing protein n=1 Tax=Candidatus Accumulibacter meliphilus TaxID=2211374 RepID=UPI002FC2D35A